MRTAVRTFLATLTLVAAGGCNLLSRDAGAGAGARSIKAGTAETGTLADSDPMLRNNRGPYQVWSLRGTRGQRLVIDLSSSAFDPLLALRDESGFLIASDDDGGGSLAARVRTILPRDGRYLLVVTSVNRAARGEYRLTISEWVAPGAPEPGVAQSLALGEAKDGILEPGDELSGDGPYQDRWTIELQAGQGARIEMRSTDVDSYLMLLGPDGRVLQTNDDGLGNRDAAVNVRAAEAGRYTVLATTYGDHPRVGAYRVGATELTGAVATGGSGVPITDGQTITGMLEEGDTTVEGRRTDLYDFRPERSGTLTLEMRSTEFDAYLALRDEFGQEIARDDDSGGGRDARLTHPVQAGTLYRIGATSFGSGTGSYQVTARIGP